MGNIHSVFYYSLSLFLELCSYFIFPSSSKHQLSPLNMYRVNGLSPSKINLTTVNLYQFSVWFSFNLMFGWQFTTSRVIFMRLSQTVAQSESTRREGVDFVAGYNCKKTLELFNDLKAYTIDDNYHIRLVLSVPSNFKRMLFFPVFSFFYTSNTPFLKKIQTLKGTKGCLIR